jgi:cell shape-determining protein MreC
MTKIYHLDKNARSKSNRGPVLVLVIIVLVALLMFGLLGGLQSLTKNGATPVWKFSSELSQRLSLNAEVMSKPKRILIAENQALRKELNNINAQVARAKDLEIENRNLLSVMGRLPNTDYILGNVLASPRQSAYKRLIIDLGDTDISIGSLALAEGYLAIGLVDETFGQTSFVKPFSEASAQTSMIHQDSGTMVTVRGGGGSHLFFDAPRDLEVSEGDLLVYPGGGNYISGVVEDVEFDARDSSKKVSARLPANVNSLRWLVILPN